MVASAAETYRSEERREPHHSASGRTAGRLVSGAHDPSDAAAAIGRAPRPAHGATRDRRAAA